MFYLLLLGVVWLTDIGFTACNKDSYWCSTAYWLTESAGKYGTLIIIIAVSIIYAYRSNGIKEKARTFFKSLLSITVVLALFAFVNEHLTKQILKYPRPSHSFLVSQTKSQPEALTRMYDLDAKQREAYLQSLIDLSPVLQNNIDKKVLSHWVEESGYSFPSGHSFNAFLLAAILSFSIYNGPNYKRYRVYYFIPFVWAFMIGISRVAIGAHSALDVSVGAALGLMVAWTLIYFDTTQRLIIRHKHL